MKTLDLFFDAKEIALFMSCFRLNKGEIRGFLLEDDEILV